MENGARDAPRPLSELLLAAVGWASLGLEAVDELADDLARRLGVERDEMRAAVRDTLASWRAEADRVGGRTDDVLDHALSRAGVARRDDVEELALRVAQLEHRTRLLERDAPA
jgi:polyhydroxyalkanoate synthesis regulator phasin